MTEKDLYSFTALWLYGFPMLFYLPMSLTDPIVVVLDVETTGLKPEDGHEIIEIAAQKVQGQDVVGEFCSLVKPIRRVEADVEKVHGISNELLAVEGKSPEDVFPAFVAFLGNLPIVAHNAPFDVGFINAHLKRMGIPTLTNQILDTITLAKKYLIIPSYSLQKVAAYLEVPQPTAHRALADVETTRQVFWKLVQRAKGK